MYYSDAEASLSNSENQKKWKEWKKKLSSEK